MSFGRSCGSVVCAVKSKKPLKDFELQTQAIFCFLLVIANLSFCYSLESLFPLVLVVYLPAGRH